MERYKMSILVRTDIKMSRGKAVAQGAHAAVGAVLICMRRCPEALQIWLDQGAAKIALRVGSEEEMLGLVSRAQQLGLVTYVVEDMGLTEVPPGTRTCAAIGPGPESLVDQVTGSLRLL
ncbi:MAG: peptidyl-tRNA hydrolase Pth2 [Nitrososphaeria archaeon]